MVAYEEMRYYFECDECGNSYDSDVEEAPDGWEVTNGPDGATVVCDDCLAEYDDDYYEEDDEEDEDDE